MPFFLSVPRRFHPGYSLLGRWVHAHVSDARKGEAVYLLSLTMLFFLLGITQSLAWALLQPALRAGDSIDSVYWIAQLLTAALCFGVALFGFRPAFSVRIDETALVVEQAGRSWVIPHPQIEHAAIVPNLTYYRHYRRYARTVAFIGAPEPQVVVIETQERPLVLGLPSSACDTILGLLDRTRTPAETAPVSVA